MKADPKKIGALIVAKMGPKLAGAPGMMGGPAEDPENGGEGPDEGEEGRIHSASEILEAIKTGDSAAFASALHAFIQQC